MAIGLIERMIEAMVANLREQEQTSGFMFAHAGTTAQIDGRIDLEAVAAAALRAVREVDSLA